MTTATADLGARPTSPRLAVTQARVLRSEWTKFRTLRSTLWTLLIAVVLMVGIGALFSAVNASQLDTSNAKDVADFDAISTSLNGITFAQLAIGVLGVLLIAGEYSTGMIRSSLTAVPKRLPVFWGKVGVFTAAVLPLAIVMSFVSFLLGQALLDGNNLGVSLSAPGALRSVFGAAFYLTIGGLIAVALGALLRNTAAAISTFVGVFFVIPPLASLLPSSISDSIVPYFPSNAGEAMFGGGHDVTNALSPWAGFAVLSGYAVIVIGAAAWRMVRTDV